MTTKDINQEVLILNELYYWHSDIDSLAGLYWFIKKFNYNFSEEQLKEATMLFMCRILTDGSHFFKTNHMDDAIVFSKANNNVKEGLAYINKYWNIMLQKIENRDSDPGIFLDDGTIVNVMPDLIWTENWQNEVCKVSKMGYRTTLNFKCPIDPNYQYQMPAHRFIPDNDCGFEE